MNKDTWKDSLMRMGIPIYPGDKVQKSEILSLPFRKSGMEITSIEPIKTEMFPKYCMHRIHLKVKDGEAEKIDAMYEKNKKSVEAKLTDYYKKMTNGMLGSVKIKIHNRNNLNCWLDICFYYNPKAIVSQVFDPFCYHLLERD